MSWSDLPAELLTAIAGRLVELADLARFRSVCPSWRSASAALATRRHVPLLLLPSTSLSGDTRKILSLTENRLLTVHLPAAHDPPYLFASTHGWALGIAYDLSALLLHPFTGATANVPALPDSFRNNEIRDMVWDWSPHVIMASCSGETVTCRPGDHSWAPVPALKSTAISSIDYRDGSFFVLEGRTCETMVVDAASLAVANVIPPPRGLRIPDWRFMANVVVSSNELLLMVRTVVLHFDRFDNVKICKIFRMDRRSHRPDWSEVTGIGDRALFVDNLRAFFVEANEFNGLRRNCMYFASSFESVDDDYGMCTFGHYTVTMLGLEDLRSEELRCDELWRYKNNRFWQWPSWVIPTLSYCNVS